MKVTGLLHVAIKSQNLDATVEFYSEVLGMKLADRPDFGFPGAWIAQDDGTPIIHIYAGEPALDHNGRPPYGSAAVDHVSLTVVGWDECLKRIERFGQEWRAATVPGLPLWQIFVYDPSGILLELTFDARVEARPTPEIPPDRVYRPGKLFGVAKAMAA